MESCKTLRKSILEKEREIEVLNSKVKELEERILSNELAVVNNPNQERYMNMLSIFSNNTPALEDMLSVYNSYSQALAAKAKYNLSLYHSRAPDSGNDLLENVKNCFRNFDRQISLLVQLELHYLIKITRQIRNTLKGLLHILFLETDLDRTFEIEMYRKKLCMLLFELGNFWSINELKRDHPLVFDVLNGTFLFNKTISLCSLVVRLELNHPTILTKIFYSACN